MKRDEVAMSGSTLALGTGGTCDGFVPAVGIQSWRKSSKIKLEKLDKEQWCLTLWQRAVNLTRVHGSSGLST